MWKSSSQDYHIALTSLTRSWHNTDIEEVAALSVLKVAAGNIAEDDAKVSKWMSKWTHSPDLACGKPCKK